MHELVTINTDQGTHSFAWTSRGHVCMEIIYHSSISIEGRTCLTIQAFLCAYICAIITQEMFKTGSRVDDKAGECPL